MKRLLLSSLGLFLMTPAEHAHAHIDYYDIFNGPSIKSVLGSTTTYSGSSVVAGNFGWADAADFDWGDSHVGSWVKFNVIDPNGSFVNITVSGDGFDRYLNDDPSQRLIRSGDLTPGISLYRGVLPDEAYDELTLVAGKEGAWRALGNTSMENDYGEFGSIVYLAHAGEADSLQTTQSLGRFLEQGSYTLAIGGTCYLRDACGALQAFGADVVSRGYDIAISVSPTAPVPLPAAAWLMLTGLLGGLKAGGFAKRR